MRTLTRVLKQKAVYWAKASANFDAYGRPQWATATQIKCRWEECLEEIIDANNIRRMSTARVFVDRELAVGGVLFLGTLSQVSDLSNPKSNNQSFEIIKFSRTPTLRGKHWQQVAYL